MFYREFSVTDLLRPFIHCIWVIQEKAGVFAKPELLVPDGNIEVMLNFGNSYTRFFSQNPNNFCSCKGGQLVGQRSSYCFHASPDGINLISISFKPGGISPFVHFPVSDVTDESIAFCYLKDKFFAEMEERLFAINTLEERIACIQELLLKRLYKNTNRANRVFAFVPMVHAMSAYTSVKEFLNSHTINKRKLERDFDFHVGLSPKFMQRILRFKNAIHTVYNSKIKSLTELAYECGYYDQAHMNMDFREFSGLTPKQYFSGTCTWDELMKDREYSG
jgi:AraC-like DNA-binding protein